MRLFSSLSILAACLAPCAARAATDDSALTAVDSLQVYRLFTGEDQKTHVEIVPLTLVTGKYGLKSLIDAKAERVKMGVSPDGMMMDYHVALHRTLLMPLQGFLVIGLGDGSVHRLPPGSVALAEDRTGQGHISGCEAKNDARQCWTLQINLDDADVGLQSR